MDAVRLGTICRTLRMKRGWRQQDLADRAGVTRQGVSLLERGRITRLRVDVAVGIIVALGGNTDFVGRWQGGDLDRLLNARHSALHESVARFFLTLPGWVLAPEISFAIRGERGVIDILAWHQATRTLLVIELKNEIVDINELLGTLDRKQRLAGQIARDRGWYPKTVAVWLLVAGGVMNRRRVASHASVLRAVLPSDGRSIHGWLKQPVGQIRCLSFWSYDQGRNTKSGTGGARRVRVAKGARTTRPSSVAPTA